MTHAKPANKAKIILVAAAICAAGCSATGLAIATLGGGAAMLLAGEAIAGNNIPGVGVIIKSGSVTVARAVSDENGEATFRLEPGEYTVTIGNLVTPLFIKLRTRDVKVVVTGTKHNYVGHVTVLR